MSKNKTKEAEVLEVQTLSGGEIELSRQGQVIEGEIVAGDTDEEALRRCEQSIETGLEWYFRAGLALKEISDRKLYRLPPYQCQTFQRYCELRWGIGKTQGYRLITAAEVVQNLSPTGDILPEKERQVRPLAKLKDPELQRKAWQLVLDFAGSNPTSQQVEEAVSKVKSGLGRKADDFYPTAAPLVTALLDQVPEILPSHRVLEPCAGDGAMWRILSKRQQVPVDAGDIAAQFDSCFQWDATDPDNWEKRDWEQEDKLWAQDWTITNPPFKDAESILDLAYRHSRIGVALLLRLSFLEPCNGRGHWLENHANELRYVIPVNPRPQFRDDTKGTDSSTVAWLVWLKGWSWQKDLKIAPPFKFIRNWR